MVAPSVDLLPAGYLVISLAREVRFANAFFRSDFGLDPAAVMGSPIETLLTRASSIFYESYVHPTLMTEGFCNEASITIISGTGERVPVVVNARLLPGADPVVVWCVMRADNRDKIYEELRKARQKLQVNAERFELLASTDALTGLPNRRAFEAKAHNDFLSAERYNQPVGLVMIDIDHFKKLNDTFGHATGDEVLRKVGKKLLDLSRKHEIIGRYGGEEFICCLPPADRPGAFAFAKRIHAAVRTIMVEEVRVTASVGIAIRPPGSGLDLAAATHLADLALYEAKSTGRDRIMCYTESGFVPCD